MESRTFGHCANLADSLHRAELLGQLGPIKSEGHIEQQADYWDTPFGVFLSLIVLYQDTSGAAMSAVSESMVPPRSPAGVRRVRFCGTSLQSRIPDARPNA
jgi:hypothetical protein